MRRVALVLALVLAFAVPMPHATAGAARDCHQRATGPASVKALIKCAAPKLGVSTSHALYIAWRESRYQPWVCNSSDHCGVFQIYPPLWSHMVGRYVWGRLLDPLSRTHGRANVILSLRLMRHEGFWPWGG